MLVDLTHLLSLLNNNKRFWNNSLNSQCSHEFPSVLDVRSIPLHYSKEPSRNNNAITRIPQESYWKVCGINLRKFQFSFFVKKRNLLLTCNKLAQVSIFFLKGESKRTPCEKSVAFAYLRSIPPLLRSRQLEIEMDLSQFSEKQKTILKQVRGLIVVLLPYCVVQCCNGIKIYRRQNCIWILLFTFIPYSICVIYELLLIERWKYCIIDLLFTSTFQGMLPH